MAGGIQTSSIYMYWTEDSTRKRSWRTTGFKDYCGVTWLLPSGIMGTSPHSCKMQDTSSSGLRLATTTP